MMGNNYHTHTKYCDGKDSPEELVREALAKGCTEIGFSGHSFTDIPDEDPFCMTPESTEQYKAEVLRLKERYKGKISVLLGVEQDYFSECDTADYDYVIGSVHYVKKDGVFLPVDESKKLQEEIVRTHYQGDFYAFAEDYYDLVGKVADKTACHIVGHFDLIAKYNEKGDLFNPEHPRYQAAADRALEKLLNRGLYFEINYGAVQKGLRSSPYPEDRILQKLLQNKEKILYASDCHQKEFLLFGIETDNEFVPLRRQR